MFPKRFHRFREYPEIVQTAIRRRFWGVIGSATVFCTELSTDCCADIQPNVIVPALIVSDKSPRMSESVKSKTLGSGKRIGFSDRLIAGSPDRPCRKFRYPLRLANGFSRDRSETTPVVDHPK